MVALCCSSSEPVSRAKFWSAAARLARLIAVGGGEAGLHGVGELGFDTGAVGHESRDAAEEIAFGFHEGIHGHEVDSITVAQGEARERPGEGWERVSWFWGVVAACPRLAARGDVWVSREVIPPAAGKGCRIGRECGSWCGTKRRSETLLQTQGGTPLPLPCHVRGRRYRSHRRSRGGRGP